jgi:hypothetical protein
VIKTDPGKYKRSPAGVRHGVGSRPSASPNTCLRSRNSLPPVHRSLLPSMGVSASGVLKTFSSGDGCCHSPRLLSALLSAPEAFTIPSAGPALCCWLFGKSLLRGIQMSRRGTFCR